MSQYSGLKIAGFILQLSRFGVAAIFKKHLKLEQKFVIMKMN